MGAGRCLTDEEGRYRFTTIKPGPYPWSNHTNAWRPAHIHFSLFGRAFTQRLVTQMYFPGDPLFYQDPIFNGVRDEAARKRMVSTYDHAATRRGVGHRLPLRHRARRRGRDAAGGLMEFVYDVTDVPASAGPTPWQTVGPFFHDALPYDTGSLVVGADRPGAFTLRGHVHDGGGDADPRRAGRGVAGRRVGPLRHRARGSSRRPRRTASAGSAAARRTPTAATRSRRSGRPAYPRRTGRRRRRTWRCRCSRAACCAGW